MCGYPLCSNPLGPQPRQKYHISLAQKKVFDLTQRKVCVYIVCLHCGSTIILCCFPVEILQCGVLPSFKLLCFTAVQSAAICENVKTLLTLAFIAIDVECVALSPPFRWSFTGGWSSSFYPMLTLKLNIWTPVLKTQTVAIAI